MSLFNILDSVVEAGGHWLNIEDSNSISKESRSEEEKNRQKSLIYLYILYFINLISYKVHHNDCEKHLQGWRTDNYKLLGFDCVCVCIYNKVCNINYVKVLKHSILSFIYATLSNTVWAGHPEVDVTVWQMGFIHATNISIFMIFHGKPSWTKTNVFIHIVPGFIQSCNQFIPSIRKSATQVFLVIII